MSAFYKIINAMRRKPWYVRLSLIFSSFALLEAPVSYLMAHGMDRSIASILFFSGVLAALLFRWKRAFVVQCMLLASHVTIIYHIKGPTYPSIPVITMATFTNFFIIWAIGSLRNGWEMAEDNIEKQKELIEKQNRLAALKDQFLQNVNHEMRSPLSVINSILDIFRDGRLDEQERDMFLDHAIYSGAELQRIADNILDAMRCDNDVSPPWVRDFDLSKVVADVLRHINSSGHTICIDIPEGIMAYADSQQVGQVVRNLLSNCFKYAPKGTPVSVRIWQDDTFTYVRVKDNGPGIAPDQLPLMFQKFSRLPADLAGPVRGIGLGLYICRRFIENMGGRIWVESTGIEGEGSSFTFTVPCIPQTTHKMRSVHKKMWDKC